MTPRKASTKYRRNAHICCWMKTGQPAIMQLIPNPHSPDSTHVYTTPENTDLSIPPANAPRMDSRNGTQGQAED